MDSHLTRDSVERCPRCGNDQINEYCENCFDRCECGAMKSIHSQLCSKTCEGGRNNNDSFEDLLERLFVKAKINAEFRNFLLSNSDKYKMVFTSKTVDPNKNYEVFEHLGDSIINSFLPFYFFRNFPQLNCNDGVKILNALKSKFVSKDSLSKIATDLGFWNHIIAVEAEKENDKKSLLEDVFEAFLGLTVYLLDEEYFIGMGYGVVYKILESIFEDIDISLEHDKLFDAKTRLKEIMDVNPQLGSLIYTHKKDQDVNVCEVFLTHNSIKTRMAMVRGHETRMGGEQTAAQIIIDKFKEQNIERVTNNRLFCEKISQPKKYIPKKR